MTDQKEIPLAFPRREKMRNGAVTVLAGDVGGTKTNLALFYATKDGIKPLAESTYHSARYTSCVDIIQQFLSENPQSKPDRICLGVAGPVVQGKVEITNLSWYLDSEEIRTTTKVAEVALINDLEATSYGLAGLDENDFITVYEGVHEGGDNMAIIAPGTGLGEAGLYWDGKSYHPFATEGGHSDYSPRTELDLELYQYLQEKYGIVSWEKVVGGPGIYDIYRFLCDVKKRATADWLDDALQKDDPSAVISQSALEEKDPVCIETMNLYVRYLARESSNLVLKLKATGGLFLGGGIPPKITSLLQQNVFYNNFLDCDRMQHLLKRVPIKIILNNKTALIGAAYYGAYGA